MVQIKGLSHLSILSLDLIQEVTFFSKFMISNAKVFDNLKISFYDL